MKVYWIGLIFLGACSQKPVPIRYNQDECYYCKMLISDRRFGAEVITQKGKVYKFDDLGCMVKFMKEEPSQAEKAALFVVDYTTGDLIEALSAFYLHTPQVPSPMNDNILSFADRDSQSAYHRRYAGTLLTWEEVRKQLAEKKKMMPASL
ncbi:MAG: nitrous oxide reductase accessory protein NosL [Bacteroidia bacterium]